MLLDIILLYWPTKEFLAVPMRNETSSPSPLPDTFCAGF